MKFNLLMKNIALNVNGKAKLLNPFGNGLKKIKSFFQKPIDKLPKIWYNIDNERDKGDKKMIIVFDMDGTVADLYSVENWLPKLRNEDPTPYAEAKPLWNMEELNKVLDELRNEGHYINVVSWLSKNSTEAYKAKVRKAKREWLAEHMPTDYCHLVQYGTPKARVIKKYAEATEAILIDDEAKNREAWTLGRTIDPTSCDLIEALRGLL